MPSSLTTLLPPALGSSPHPPVSVYGTGPCYTDYFQASLKIQPDNPEAMFYVGHLYQESGDTENANAMFDKIVGEHGDSEYAQKASTARGY